MHTCVYSMCYVLFLGCRGTVYLTADPKRSTGLAYLNKLYLISPVSCVTVQIQSRVYLYSLPLFFLHFCGLMLLFCPFFLFMCVFWSSSIARSGHGGGTVAGMRGRVSSIRLCKCPPYIHHQTIKITIQPSLTTSPSPPQPLLSERQSKTTSSFSLIGQNRSVFTWPLQLSGISAYTTLASTEQLIPQSETSLYHFAYL